MINNKNNLSLKYSSLAVSLLLVGGAHAAPADQPIEPVAYQSMLGNGFDVKWSQFNESIDNYKTQHVVDLAAAGFKNARIRTDLPANAELFAHMDQRVQDCLDNNVTPIIAYNAGTEEQSGKMQPFLDWWKVVAEHYQDYSHKVAFNLVIEPSHALADPAVLNLWYQAATDLIRETNPTRIIIYGAAHLSQPENLENIVIPTSANGYAMAEWHINAAGTSWVGANKPWTSGAADEVAYLRSRIQKAVDYQNSPIGVPTWFGAWMPGNYNNGDDYSVEQQTIYSKAFMAALAEHNIPWSVNVFDKFYDEVNSHWLASQEQITDVMNGDAPLYPHLIPGPDADNDGLTDDEEIIYRTNSNLIDTDGDKFSDRAEVAAGTLPSDADSSLTPAAFVIHGAAAGELLGNGGELLAKGSGGVRNAGDVNDDGINDLIVGSPYFDGVAGPNSGRVQIISGSDGSVIFNIEGLQGDSTFGSSVAGVGDLNGDGFDDFVIGAPDEDKGSSKNRGYVRAYSGQTGLVLHSTYGQQSYSYYGASVSALGDVNGDSVPDYLASDGGHDRRNGRVFVLSGVDGTAIHSLEGATEFKGFGSSISNIDDVDGDGVADFIVGVPMDDLATGKEIDMYGSVSVYSGQTGAFLHSHVGSVLRDKLGMYVKGLGDVNGDGVPDYAANAHSKSLVLSGADSSLIFTVVAPSRARYVQDGIADINGDNKDDLLVVNSEQVQILSGSDGSMLQQYSGYNFAEDFGHGIANLGDLDDDGRQDFAVTSPRADVSGENSGSVYIFKSTVKAPAANLLENGGFEDGLRDWASYGGAKLTESDLYAYHGMSSVKVTKRNFISDGPMQNITHLLNTHGPGTYDFSAFIRNNSSDSTAKIRIEMTDDSGTITRYITGKALKREFSELSGSLNLSWSGTLSSAHIRIHNQEATESYYLDRVKITKP